MDASQDQFLRIFTIVVVSGAVALGGLGAIALHRFNHFHPVARPPLPNVECEPAAVVAADTSPEALRTPPVPEPTPARRRSRPRVPARTAKPPSVTLALDACKGNPDPLCGVAFGKER
jgi:hypothetical protein